MPPVLSKPRSHNDWLLAAALAGVAFVVFARALAFEFVSLDDNDYVTLNPYVRQGLTLGGAVRDFSAFDVANWHPLTWLSLQLDASLWQTQQGAPDPRGFHLTSVLLHAANAALLFLALRALTGARWRSAGVALLFAVHPLRVESVAWVAERKDVLSLFFGLLALWAYAVYVRTPTARRYAAVAVTLALGLMCKPVLVTLPFLLLVLDWWPLRRVGASRDWTRLVVEKLPLFALAAASCVVTYLAQERGGATRGTELFPFAVRMENATVSYLAYLGKTFWPFGLAPFYPHPGATLPGWQAAGSALLLVAVTVMAVALRRRAPYLLAGWLWFLGTLVPMIGLVQVGNQAYADRYTYFPQIGILLALCWAVADISAARPRVAVVAAVAVAMALVVRTESQLSTWHDSYALWQNALAVTEPNPTALVSLGTVEEEREHLQKAEEYYREALRVPPESFLAHLNLGGLLARQGRYDEALTELAAARELAPDYPRTYTYLGNIRLDQGDPAAAAREHQIALRLAPRAAQSYTDLAKDELLLGHHEAAADLCREALEEDPHDADAHYWLANVLLRQKPNAQNPDDEALTHLRAAVLANPSFPDAHLLLAQELYRRNDVSGAAGHYDKVVRLNPRQANAWFGLGMSFVRRRQLGSAEHCLSQAVALDGNTATYRAALATVLDALAAIQIKAGQAAGAVETERRARNMAQAAAQPELLHKIEDNLRRYERGEAPGP
jgi:tetratricopeptide (TPR) repeat protein